jgi:hypothetical protein
VTIDNITEKGSGQIYNTVVADCLKRAYNVVHNNGFVVTTSFVDSMIDLVPPPSDDEEVGDDGKSDTNATSAEDAPHDLFNTFDRTYWIHMGYTCPECTTDNNVLLPPGDGDVQSPVKEKDIMEQFQDKFCENLQESGIVALKNVEDCEIYFLYSASSTAQGQEMYMQEQMKATLGDDLPASITDYQMGTEIKISHIRPSDTATSVFWDTISNAYRASYNEIHSDTGYSVTDWMLERDLEMPEDESAQLLIATALVKFECPSCEANSLQTVFSTRNGVHEAFESLFCEKLHESGLNDFEDIHDCNIKFMYHMKKAVV